MRNDKQPFKYLSAVSSFLILTQLGFNYMTTSAFKLLQCDTIVEFFAYESWTSQQNTTFNHNKGVGLSFNQGTQLLLRSRMRCLHSEQFSAEQYWNILPLSQRKWVVRHRQQTKLNLCPISNVSWQDLFGWALYHTTQMELGEKQTTITSPSHTSHRSSDWFSPKLHDKWNKLQQYKLYSTRSLCNKLNKFYSDFTSFALDLE